jgi:hypothetical protein
MRLKKKRNTRRKMESKKGEEKRRKMRFGKRTNGRLNEEE